MKRDGHGRPLGEGQGRDASRINHFPLGIQIAQCRQETQKNVGQPSPQVVFPACSSFRGGAQTLSPSRRDVLMFVSALKGQAPGFRGIKVLRFLMPTDSRTRVSGL